MYALLFLCLRLRNIVFIALRAGNMLSCLVLFSRSGHRNTLFDLLPIDIRSNIAPGVFAATTFLSMNAIMRSLQATFCILFFKSTHKCGYPNIVLFFLLYRGCCGLFVAENVSATSGDTQLPHNVLRRSNRRLSQRNGNPLFRSLLLWLPAPF